MGRGHTDILREAHAAEVVSQGTTPIADLLDKTRHLAAIHALPASTWPDVVSLPKPATWAA